MSRVVLTEKGFEELQKELERLKTKERPKIMEAVARARAFGDLRENAEYHAARESQSLIEERIRSLEMDIAEAKIINIKNIPASGKVLFGTTVELKKHGSKKTLTYQIVGESEAGLDKGKISYTSPLGKSLIGSQVGDICELKTEAGKVEYKILKIDHI